MALLALLTALPTLLRAQMTATEAEIEAAFLYNFARYVRWPGEDEKVFPLCVHAADQIVEPLRRAVGGKQVGAAPIEIRQVEEPDEMRECRILFLGDGSDIDDLVPRLADASVLTVSDQSGFAQRGGIIGFRREDKRLQLDINLDRAEHARLTISSQLLKLARIVKADGLPPNDLPGH